LLGEPLHEGNEDYFDQKPTVLPYAAQGSRLEVVRFLAETYPVLIGRPDHQGRVPINTLPIPWPRPSRVHASQI